LSRLSWDGDVLLSSGSFFSHSRCALRKASKENMKSGIPPMLGLHQHGTGLTAQAVFRSEPSSGFLKKLQSTNSEMIQKKLVS